jgi:hypothetical protein
MMMMNSWRMLTRITNVQSSGKQLGIPFWIRSPVAFSSVACLWFDAYMEMSAYTFALLLFLVRTRFSSKFPPLFWLQQHVSGRQRRSR